MFYQCLGVKFGEWKVDFTIKENEIPRPICILYIRYSYSQWVQSDAKHRSRLWSVFPLRVIDLYSLFWETKLNHVRMLTGFSLSRLKFSLRLESAYSNIRIVNATYYVRLTEYPKRRILNTTTKVWHDESNSDFWSRLDLERHWSYIEWLDAVITCSADIHRSSKIGRHWHTWVIPPCSRCCAA